MKVRSPKVNLIVADNGSTDETVSIAKAHDVDVVEMGTNSGFGAACNAGARAGSAPAILFLNPDALTTPNNTLRPTCQLPHPSGWPTYQHLHDQGVATTDGIHPILVQRLPRPVRQSRDAPISGRNLGVSVIRPIWESSVAAPA